MTARISTYLKLGPTIYYLSDNVTIIKFTSSVQRITEERANQITNTIKQYNVICALTVIVVI